MCAGRTYSENRPKPATRRVRIGLRMFECWLLASDDNTKCVIRVKCTMTHDIHTEHSALDVGHRKQCTEHGTQLKQNECSNHHENMKQNTKVINQFCFSTRKRQMHDVRWVLSAQDALWVNVCFFFLSKTIRLQMVCQCMNTTLCSGSCVCLMREIWNACFIEEHVRSQNSWQRKNISWCRNTCLCQAS